MTALLRRVLPVLATALLAVTAAAAPAGAATQPVKLGAAPVYYGTPDGFALTRLGGAQLSKHLLHIGDVVTESLSIQGADAFVWDTPGGFTRVAGCEGGSVEDGTGDRFCKLKAVSSTYFSDPPCPNSVGYLSGGCYNNWTVAPVVSLYNVQGEGITDDYYAILPDDQYAISGDVVEPLGKPDVDNAPVTIRVAASKGDGGTLTSDKTAHYGPGIYFKDPSVTVSGPDTTYRATNCPNKDNADGSCTFALNADTKIDFVHDTDHRLSGEVVDGSGKGVRNVTVAITGKKDASPTTDADGRFSVKLPPGGYTVTPQPKGSELPVASADCTPDNVSCSVTLDRDRSVEFAGCVVPNPDGSALPADTPDPIPGVVTTGNLEAVGCWTPDANGITYTSRQPVRLDGVDVAPGSGTTITLDKNASVVSSNGPVSLLIAGKAMSQTNALNLDYKGSEAATGTPGGMTNAGSVSGLFGLPFSFNVGVNSGSSGGPIPWSVQRGSTTMNLAVGLPSGLLSTFSPTVQRFLPPGTARYRDQPTVGLNGTLQVTNRAGVASRKICGDIGGAQLRAFGAENAPDSTVIRTPGGISALSLCYDPAAAVTGYGGIGGGQWTGTGTLTLPSKPGIAGLGITGTVGFNNYTLNQLGVSVANVNKPLGYGVFLQSAGLSYSRDLARGVTNTLTGTGGITFGPQVTLPPDGSRKALAAANGSMSVQFSNPQQYKIAGGVSLFPGTAFQYDLASAFATLTLPPNVRPIDLVLGDPSYAGSKLDFGGSLTLRDPILSRIYGPFGITLAVSGFYDDQHAAFSATGTYSADVPLLGRSTATVLVSNTEESICLAISKSKVVRDSQFGIVHHVQSGKTDVTQGTCGLGRFSPTQSATQFLPSGSAHTSAAKVHTRFKVASGLRSLTLAIHGRTAAPLVSLTGPGTRLKAGAGSVLVLKNALVYRDTATKITYLTVFAPRAGTYGVRTLPGSSRITALDGAVPARQAKIARARVASTGCEGTLSYTYTSVAGARTALYAVGEQSRQYLGDAAAGTQQLAFTPVLTDAAGSGTIEAVTTVGGFAQAPVPVGTYRTIAAATVTAPTDPVVSGDTLSWTGGCNAASYTVRIAGRTLTTTTNAITLPSGTRGSITPTITSVSADGTPGPSLTRRLTA